LKAKECNLSFHLTIEPLGEEIEVEEGQTVLDACLRAGIYLPHACGHGLCGTCKVEVLDGEVDHGNSSPFALMDFEREGGKTLACECRLQSDVTIEADIDEEPDARRISVKDFDCEVAQIENLTHDVKQITFKINNDKIDFQAGQYVNINLPNIEGSRAFSIANPPTENDKIVLQVRLVPNGVGTMYIHEQLKIGDKLKISGPYGRFITRKSRKSAKLFLAGGTGVSSPRSMILDLLEDGYQAPITLVHGVRTKADLYGFEEFTKLAAKYSNFTYVPALSQEPEDSGWTGARGFVHEAAKAHFDNQFMGQTAYLCGPPVMIDACITALMQGRLFERDIFTEKFLTANDAQSSKSPLFKRI
jgi:phenol/toluene 2-monooxygenase (NADH) P5/A5